MAKANKAVKRTATPVAKRNKKTTRSTAKVSGSKEDPKPPLETRTVCFTDQKTGKKFCGEMTEVPEKKPAAKVAGHRRRKR
jgi:hypothetical protein